MVPNQVADFMAITGCNDQQKADQYLQMAVGNLENAITLYLELEAQGQVSRQASVQTQNSNPNSEQGRQFVQDYNTQIFNSVNPPPSVIRQQSNPNQQQIVEYKKYVEDKRAKDDGFIKKTITGTYSFVKSLCKNILNISKSPDYGTECREKLIQQKVKVDVKLESGNFDDNLKLAQSNMRPLIVYIHDDNFNQQAHIIFQHPQLTSIITKNFNIVAFERKPQTLELIPAAVPGRPCLMIFRIDLFDKIDVLGVFELVQNIDLDQLGQKLKQIKGQYNKTYIMEEQIKKEANKPAYIHQQQEQFFNPYQPIQQPQPPQQAPQQKQRVVEQRNLIKEQDLAYQQALEQIKLEEQKKNALKREQEQLQQLQEQRQLEKATLMSNLPNEPEQGIEILFRMPSSQQKTRKFALTDKIQVLFDFVQCLPDEMFDDPNQPFNLIQNFPRLSLKERRDELIGQVFEDSLNEQLIVDQ